MGDKGSIECFKIFWEVHEANIHKPLQEATSRDEIAWNKNYNGVKKKTCRTHLPTRVFTYWHNSLAFHPSIFWWENFTWKILCTGFYSVCLQALTETWCTSWGAIQVNLVQLIIMWWWISTSSTRCLHWLLVQKFSFSVLLSNESSYHLWK